MCGLGDLVGKHCGKGGTRPHPLPFAVVSLQTLPFFSLDFVEMFLAHLKLSFGFLSVPTRPGNISKLLLHGLSMFPHPSCCFFTLELSYEFHSQFSQTHLPVHPPVYPVIGVYLEDLAALLSSFPTESSLPWDLTYQLPADQSPGITTHLFPPLRALQTISWSLHPNPPPVIPFPTISSSSIDGMDLYVPRNSMDGAGPSDSVGL